MLVDFYTLPITKYLHNKKWWVLNIFYDSGYFTILCNTFIVGFDCFISESARPTNKRRKRKGAAQNAPSNAGGGPGGGPGALGGKKRSPGPNFSLASQVTLMDVRKNSTLILNFR